MPPVPLHPLVSSVSDVTLTEAERAQGEPAGEHGWWVRVYTEPTVEAIIAARVAEAQAKALEDAADDLIPFCHKSAHERVCENQHRSDKTVAHNALDVATDWLRARAATLRPSDQAARHEEGTQL